MTLRERPPVRLAGWDLAVPPRGIEAEREHEVDRRRAAGTPRIGQGTSLAGAQRVEQVRPSTQELLRFLRTTVGTRGEQAVCWARERPGVSDRPTCYRSRRAPK
jgi:hypothetical protein